jgi:hypothetical protein
MYGYFGHGTVDASLASAASKSTFIDIRGVNRIAIEMPAFSTLLATTTANVYVEGGQATTSTFRRVKASGVYSATSGIDDWEVPSTTGNFIAVCDPIVGFNYMKVALSTAATDAISCTIHKMQ